MARALRWGAAGGVLGFTLFALLFFLALAPRPGRQDHLLVMTVFALIGATASAVLGGIFGAVRSALDEFDDLWCEIDGAFPRKGPHY